MGASVAWVFFVFVFMVAIMAGKRDKAIVIVTYSTTLCFADEAETLEAVGETWLGEQEFLIGVFSLLEFAGLQEFEASIPPLEIIFFFPRAD